jgi:hypothetical protein
VGFTALVVPPAAKHNPVKQAALNQRMSYMAAASQQLMQRIAAMVMQAAAVTLAPLCQLLSRQSQRAAVQQEQLQQHLR